MLDHVCIPEGDYLVVNCVTRRKLQTPGNAEDHKRQETPAINPLGCELCGLEPLSVRAMIVEHGVKAWRALALIPRSSSLAPVHAHVAPTPLQGEGFLLGLFSHHLYMSAAEHVFASSSREL